MKSENTILFAVLNWGMGHASRSVPIINALEELDYNIVIASSGSALQLLKKECKQNTFLELPDYGIVYPSTSMLWNMIQSGPSLFSAINSEQKLIENYCRQTGIEIIISDNRWGAYTENTYNIIISHQLVVPGKTTFAESVSTYFHRFLMRNFHEIWVPDKEIEPRLSGRLSSWKSKKPIHFIGAVSRFQKTSPEIKKDIDWLIVLSGPEPARTKLEEKLVQILLPSALRVTIVTGRELESFSLRQGMDLYGILSKDDLQNLFNRTNAFCGRSGYSTILDLAVLQVPCILIPTPGQHEQEYLAKHLADEFHVEIKKQDDLTIEDFRDFESKIGSI